MKNTFIISILLLFSLNLISQDVLLEENVKDKKEVKKGPNKKYFTHMYYGMDFYLPPNEVGSEIIYGRSWDMNFGWRAKLKVAKFYSLGYTFDYSYTHLRMKQNEDKITPDDIEYNKQSLRTHQAKLGLYNRFNFDKRRGNRIGNFLDLGVYGGYIFSTRHKNEIKEDHSTYLEVHRKLDYIERLNYGAFANLGFNSYVITFKYRLSDFFKEDTDYPEISPFTLGLQIGLHK